MKSNDQFRKDRRRKLLWILPLLVLPFATLFFWAMGGGAAISPGVKTEKGFNLKLPSAKVNDDETLDKLNYYDQAALDSSNVEELRKKTQTTGMIPCRSLAILSRRPAAMAA